VASYDARARSAASSALVDWLRAEVETGAANLLDTSDPIERLVRAILWFGDGTFWDELGRKVDQQRISPVAHDDPRGRAATGLDAAGLVAEEGRLRERALAGATEACAFATDGFDPASVRDALLDRDEEHPVWPADELLQWVADRLPGSGLRASSMQIHPDGRVVTDPGYKYAGGSTTRAVLRKARGVELMQVYNVGGLRVVRESASLVRGDRIDPAPELSTTEIANLGKALGFRNRADAARYR
jgi:hypothetical protein